MPAVRDLARTLTRVIIAPALAGGIALMVAAPVCGQTIGDCTGATDPDQGILACSQLITSNSLAGHGLAVAYDSRGQRYSQKGLYQQAIADYTKALAIDSQFVEAYTNRALAYDQTGEYDLALSDSMRALKINPDFGFAYLGRAFAYYATGQYDQAIDDYTKLIESRPNNWQNRVNRAASYFGKGDYPSAVTDYTEALRLNPNDSDIFGDRGRVLFAMGNFTDAIRDFSASVALNRTAQYPVLWLHLARRRAGTANLDELNANSVGLGSDWPRPVIQYYLGRTTAAPVFDAAKTAGQLCEAYFYVAESNLLAAQKDVAIRNLRNALNICPKTFGEYPVARAELLRLGLR